jgi:hypothetical protein
LAPAFKSSACDARASITLLLLRRDTKKRNHDLRGDVEGVNYFSLHFAIPLHYIAVITIELDLVQCIQNSFSDQGYQYSVTYSYK